MNEEALLYSFELFSKDGYKGNIEDYKELIKTNKEALDYSYSLFSTDGYEGDEDMFKKLIGVESAKTEGAAKKDVVVAPEVKQNITSTTANTQTEDTDLQSVNTSSELLENNFDPKEKLTEKLLAKKDIVPTVDVPRFPKPKETKAPLIKDFYKKTPQQISDAYSNKYSKWNQGGFEFKSYNNSVKVVGPDGESIEVRIAKKQKKEDSFLSGFGQLNMLSGYTRSTTAEQEVTAEAKINDFIEEYEKRDKESGTRYYKNLGNAKLSIISGRMKSVQRNIYRYIYDYANENDIALDTTREINSLASDPSFIKYVSDIEKDNYEANRKSDYSRRKPMEEGGDPEVSYFSINKAVQQTINSLASKEMVNAKTELANKYGEKEGLENEFAVRYDLWKSAHINSIEDPEKRDYARGRADVMQIENQLKNAKTGEDVSNLTYKLEKLKKENSALARDVFGDDTTFLLGLDGKRVNPVAAISQGDEEGPDKGGIEDLSEDYALIKTEIAKKIKSEPETLKSNYNLHLAEFNEFQKEANKIYNIYEGDYSMVDFDDAGRENLEIKMNKFGYKRNKDGVYKNVPLNVLMDVSSGRGSAKFRGKLRLEGGPKKGSYKEFDFDNWVANQKETSRRLTMEHEAWKNLYLLNIDPGSIKFDSFGDVVETFFRGVLDATPGVGNETAKKTFTTERDVKDGIQSIIQNINSTLSEGETPFELTSEQEEAFEQQFGEQLTYGTGSFLPMIPELYFTGGILKGAGAVFNYEKYLLGLEKVTWLAKSGKNSKTALDAATIAARAKRAKMTVNAYAKSKGFTKVTGNSFKQAQALVLRSLEEEGKMALLDPIFGVDMPTGAGTGFVIGGKIFNRFASKGKFLLKDNYGAVFNPVIQKNLVGGVGGAVAAQTAAPVEALIDHFQGDKSWNEFVDEKYGNMEEWAKHALIETIQFGLIGFTHMNKADLTMSVRGKTNLRNKANKKLLEAMNNGNNSEIAKWSELKGQLDQQLDVLNDQLSFEDKTVLAKNTSDTLIKINKDYKSETGDDAFDFEIRTSDNNILDGNIAKVIYPKGKKPKIIVNVNKMTKGTIPHEVYHLLSKLDFEADAGIQKAFQRNLAEKVKGLEFDLGKGSKTKDLKSVVDEVYISKSENERAEEFNANLVDVLSRPENYNQIISKNIFYQIQQDIYSYFEKTLPDSMRGLLPKLNTPESVIKFLARYGRSINKGGGAVKMNKRFEDIVIDNKELLNYKTGEKVVAEASSSKDLTVEKKIKELEDKYDEIDEQLANQEIDVDTAEQRKNAIDDQIASLIKGEVKEPVPTTVKPIKKVSKEVEQSVEEFEKEASEEVSISNANKKTAKINEDIVNEMIELGANKVSDIKDPIKRKQIIDRLGRNNVGAVTNLAKKAAAAGKNLGIDDISRVDYSEFFSGFSEELSALIKSYKTDVDGKKVPFGAYMAKNLPLRYGQILDKALQGKVQGSKSLDTEAGAAGAVSEVSGDANTSLYGDNIDSGRPAGKLIDVTEFPRVKDKEAEIRDAVNIDGLDIENLTYKDVQNSFAGDVGAIILGVHNKSAEGLNKNLAERIMGTRTLNYGKKGNAGEVEVKAMQNLFKSYSDVVKFIKTMPEYNIAPRETTVDKQGKSIDLTDDAKGYAIGVSNKILKQFYEPYIDPKSKSTDADIKAQAITSPSGRGKAKTSQVATVYRLKPEYRGNISKSTVQDLQQRIGITPAGEAYIPIIGKKRAEFGTALQGLTKIYAANVANTIVRKKIVEQGIKPDTKTIDQALADIGGGKAAGMFSIDLAGRKKYEEGMKSFEVKSREELKKILKIKLPEDIKENIEKLISRGDVQPKEVFQAISDIATKDLSITAKRSFGVKLISDLTKAEGKDFGAILASNLKDVRKIFKYEYETIGFEMETADLKEKLKNVKNQVDKDQLVKDWLLSVSRSARSSSGENLLYVSTNKKIVENVLQDLLGKNSKFTVGESVRDGRTVTFVKYDGKGLEGFLDITEFKTKGIKEYAERVTREADKARELALNKVDRLKYRLNKKEITKSQFDIMLDSYLSLIKLDQRGLIRKMSKPNSEIKAGKYKPTSLYLEHKMSAEEIRDLLYSYGQGEVKTREQVLDILEKEALVNIMPKSLASKLPNFVSEKAKNPEYKNAEGYKTKEYLDAAQKYKDEIFDADGNPGMFSKDLSKEFNEIIENKTGIASFKKYDNIKASIIGQNKGKYKFFIPSSAEDFVGLLYDTLGKGKKGDAQMAWYKKNLLDPFAIGVDKVSKDRVYTSAAFRAVKKDLGIVPRDLKKKIKGEDFNQEQAIRVYIWNKQGYKVPGISKNDVTFLSNYTENNAKLKDFADKIIAINRGQDYLKPSEDWAVGTITTDIQGALNTSRRAEYLKQWQENVDVIFSKENMNKLEAAYGIKYRKAMESILGRMKSGRNRTFGGDPRVERFVDWWKSSTGVTMFFNTKSAALQTLSSVNFIDFGANNIFAASKAFANQFQYWKDFKMLFNSDFLVSRRDGLKMNVNEADIADLAKERGARGVMNRILKLGFTPTQMADSFAIAAGGATYYRNYFKKFMKEVDANGNKVYTEKQAHDKAMMKFRESAETSQQSSRPDKISQQQASALGSTVLAYANTPAQYAREIKKAARDLKNGRGDVKTNVSKILYYGFAQNLIFTALQQALFAVSFEDDEDAAKAEIKVINGMADSILRGLGVYGAATSVLKNTALKLYKETKKKNPDYSSNIAVELTSIVPPVSSKLKKIASAGRVMDWKSKEITEKGFSLDSPALEPATKYISAATNLPLDRVYTKVNNILTATEENLKMWQRIALISGWKDWEIDAKKEEDKKPTKTKSNRRSRKLTRKLRTRRR